MKSQATLNLSRNIVKNPQQLSLQEMELSIKETLSKPQIRTVFKEHGDICYSVIKITVSRFLASFGFSTKQNDFQIETIAIDTFDHFGYESLEDIIVFFKLARQGKFGTTGRGVDSNLIFGDWLPKYLAQKADLRAKIHTDKKNEAMKPDPISYEQVQISYAKNRQARLKQDAILYIENFTKNMDRQELEDTIDHWTKSEELSKYVGELKRQRRVIVK